MYYNLYDNGSGSEGEIVVGSLAASDFISLSVSPVGRLEAVNKSYVDLVYLGVGNNGPLTGTFIQDVMPAFSGDVVSHRNTGLLNLEDKLSTAQTGWYSKVSATRTGLVNGGSRALSPDDIPALRWTNINRDLPDTLGGYGITDVFEKEGSTVNGNLLLAAAPVAPLDASTKGYVESKDLNHKDYAAGDLVIVENPTTPTGFLRPNGAVLQKAMYPDLYNVIGDRYDRPSLTQSGFNTGTPWLNQFSFNFGSIPSALVGAAQQDLPYGGRKFTSVVTRNRIYVFTENEVYLNGLLDGMLTGPWITLPQLPVLANGASAIIVDDTLHLICCSTIGGVGSYNTKANIHMTAEIMSDGSLGGWDFTGTNAPIDSAYSKSFLVNGKLIIVTHPNQTEDGVLKIYVSSINTDKTISEPVDTLISMTVRSVDSTFVIGDAIYFCTRGTDGGTTIRKFNVGIDGVLIEEGEGINYSSYISGCSFVTQQGVYFTRVATSVNDNYRYACIGLRNGELDQLSYLQQTGISTSGSSVVLVDNYLYEFGGRPDTVDSISASVVQYPITGGRDNYSNLYGVNGTTTPIGNEGFTLPTFSDAALNGSRVYIKY